VVLKVTLRGLKGYLDTHNTHPPAHARTHFVSTFPTFSLFLYNTIHVSTPTHMPKRARTHPHLQHCVCVCVCVQRGRYGHSLHCGDRRYL
jgi:hypothetical protein